MRIASSSDGLNTQYQCTQCILMPQRNSARVITWWVHDKFCINLEGSVNAMQGVPVLHQCKSYQLIVEVEPYEAADKSLLIEMKSVLCSCCHQQFTDKNDVASELQSSTPIEPTSKQPWNWCVHKDRAPYACFWWVGTMTSCSCYTLHFPFITTVVSFYFSNFESSSKISFVKEKLANITAVYDEDKLTKRSKLNMRIEKFKIRLLNF